MIKSGLASRPATIGAKIQSFARLSCFFSLVVALLVTGAAAPPDQQNPDEIYIKIMALIDRADALQATGQADAAKAKYQQAEKALLYFKATNPLFAPKTVAYRLKEVTDKAEARPPVPEPTPSTSAEKPKTNLEAPAAASKSGVKLIDAGAEPRNVLRYHPKAGDKQLAIMTMKIKIDVPMPPTPPGGTPRQMPTIPAITIPMDMTVQGVAANGDITFESVIGDAGFKEEPGMQPEMVQGMKNALAGLKGLTSTGVISSRGVSKKMDIKAPANADAQTRQMMDQIKEGVGNVNVPFPEEPVGVGAKWEMKKVTKVQAASVDQTGTYELTAAEGDRVTVKANVAFSGTAPMAKGAPTGMEGSGSATGTSNLDLSKLVGSSANLDMHMEIPMGKNGTMKMDMNMSIEAQ